MKGKKQVAVIVLVLVVLALLFVIITRSGVLNGEASSTPNPTPDNIVTDQPDSGNPELNPTPEPTPEPTPTPTPTPTPEPTPTPGPYADKPDIDITDWKYVMANKNRLLSADYIPELRDVGNGHMFDERAADALLAFLDGARDAGLSVYLTSSYRSYATQEMLYNNKLAQYGGDHAVASRIVAVPGSSEHQTGLSADIVDKYYQFMDESLANTELSKWMKEHCAEYGFILRYPQDKQEITGIMFEPWHFRYVGEEAASYIMEHGLCLEEFVALYEQE